ncbi:MAG TPA: ankyrin repeat domain-containing protein [Vicinamibacterales bacterium]|nr:ankyrin repeat domain-containing protein [Vicinamibacterales bacterium]
MSAPSVRRSSLSLIRQDAKRLVRAARAGDAAALARLRAALPRAARLDDTSLRRAIKLADAQHAIAREHGHANWAALARHDDPLERFLVAVRGGALAEIARHLPAFAPLAAASVHAAAALGDHDALERHLERDASSREATHRGWTPFVYVCASPINRLSARHSAGLLDCARLLLDRGVDATASTPEPGDPASAVPAFVRAIKNANAPVAMLIQRWALTSDSGLSPATAADLRAHMTKWMQQRPPWADAFKEYFQRPDVREQMKAGMEEWKQRYGAPHHEIPSDLRAPHSPRAPRVPPILESVMPGLLARGYDTMAPGTDGRTTFHRLAAASSPEIIALALDHGADLHVRDDDGFTPLAAAIRADNRAVVDLLRSRGASDAEVTDIDGFVGACAGADLIRARQIVERDPSVLDRLGAGDYDILIRAAATNDANVVRTMLDAGVDPNGVGHSGATALHLAAWHGHAEIVHLLLAAGARRDIADTTYHTRAIDWAKHGSVHCRDAAEDYEAIVDALGG